MKKMKKRICENHVYLYFIPHVTFSFPFLHAVTFVHGLHLDFLRRQIEIETESMCGYNAGPPMAIPIYTVLPYCVKMQDIPMSQQVNHVNN